MRLPLWPSHANRWVQCPGQPWVNKVAMRHPRKDSPYAEGGKLAHGILESILSGRALGECVDEKLLENRSVLEWREWLPEDEIAAVLESVEQIQEYAKSIDGEIICESTLNLSFPYAGGEHEMHLRIDILIVNAYSVTVIDYKHGAGMRVYLDDNKQMTLYALAAREKYPNKVISTGILQPRGMGEGLDLTMLDDKYLDRCFKLFGEAIETSYQGTEYNQGAWCQMCVGNEGFCPAQLAGAIETAAVNDGKIDENMPWWVLDNLDDLKRFVKGVDEYSYTWLKEGRRIPGWALVSKPGRRKWDQPEEVPAVLAELLGGTEDDYKQKQDPKPITITEASKLAKKRKIDISALVQAPTTLKRERVEESEMQSMGAFEMSSVEE